MKLSIAEFAYNSSVNRTTYKSPHEIVYGFRTGQPVDLIRMAITIESQSLHFFLPHTCMSCTKKLVIESNRATLTINYELTSGRNLKLNVGDYVWSRFIRSGFSRELLKGCMPIVLDLLKC